MTSPSIEFLASLPDDDSLPLSSIAFSDAPDDVSLIPDDQSLVTDARAKLRACTLTIFPKDKDKKWLLPTTYWADTTGLLYWAGQFELCPKTNKLHAHIYMEWSHAKYKQFSAVRKLFHSVVGTHINVSKQKQLSIKSRDCGLNYVLKPVDGFISFDDQFIWPHCKTPVAFNQALWEKRTKPLPKDTKEDKEKTIIDYLESKGRSMKYDAILHESYESKILLASCGWAKKYHESRKAEIPRRNIESVIIMYGAGGTGKTTFAHKWDTRTDEDHGERYYLRNPDDGVFWGGGRTAYNGQRVIHMEEFCGQEKLSNLKAYMDIGKPGPPVSIKNSGAELNHDTIFFTSNHHPAAWYRSSWDKDPKQFHPFWRRVSQVWFFPSHRQDGTMNIPDDEHPPYYIDQTDDWKSIAGDWDACKDHAGKHWALKDIDGGFGGVSGNLNPQPGSVEYDQQRAAKRPRFF